jgi:hypothetical protein
LWLCFFLALVSSSAIAQETPAAAPTATLNEAPSTLSSSNKAGSLDTLKLLSQMLSLESDGLMSDSAALKLQVSELLKQLDLSMIEQSGLKLSLKDLTSWSESLMEVNSRTLEKIQQDLVDAIAAQASAERQRDAWRTAAIITAGAGAGLAIGGPVGAAIGAVAGAAVSIFISAMK